MNCLGLQPLRLGLGHSNRALCSPPLGRQRCRTTKEVVLAPIAINRNADEGVLIEGSINSVRISIKVKQKDEIERILAYKFSQFLMRRAEQFIVMRRVAIKVPSLPAYSRSCFRGVSMRRFSCTMQGYTISFLITNTHLESMFKHKLIDFIIQFMEDIDKEINELKLAINARSRIVATSFLEAFVR